MSDYLIRGEPQLTQENLIENAARELEVFGFLDALDGEWVDLEIEDEE